MKNYTFLHLQLRRVHRHGSVEVQTKRSGQVATNHYPKSTNSLGITNMQDGNLRFFFAQLSFSKKESCTPTRSIKRNIKPYRVVAKREMVNLTVTATTVLHSGKEKNL